MTPEPASHGSDLWEFIKWAAIPFAGAVGWLGNYLLGNRKADVDEAALVLGKWKEMVEAHEHQLTRMQKQIDDAEDRSRERERMQQGEIDELRGKVRALEDENAGLRRQIAQQSQTAFTVLPASPASAKTAESVKRRGLTPLAVTIPPDFEGEGI